MRTVLTIKFLVQNTQFLLLLQLLLLLITKNLVGDIPANKRATGEQDFAMLMFFGPVAELQLFEGTNKLFFII